jgi:electron transfer flavoprotein alpha subunit
MTTLLLLVEQEDGGLASSSRKVATFARRLAAEANLPLEVAVVGTASGPTLEALREQGVAVVHELHHDLLEAYAPEGWAAALSQLATEAQAGIVVAPATTRGSEVLTHLAARLDLPLAANCTEVHPVGDGFELTRLRWGGVLLEDARLEATTALLTVAPHHGAAEPAEAPGAAVVREVVPDLDAAEATTQVRELATRSQGVSLATAPVVVAGGRGVGSAEGFALLEELAALLGGAVGCSRVATNNGWRSHNDQVGQTGTRVAPDLYIALGISGATQHWVGCMGAKRILAVNVDEAAPMVTRADYAVLGDLHEFMPALVDAVRRRKAG